MKQRNDGRDEAQRTRLLILVEDLESIIILIESVARSELVKRLHRYKLHLKSRNARVTNYEVIDDDIPFYFRILL